jgi:vacuolar-type H+-ATPase subunit I/STV1
MTVLHDLCENTLNLLHIPHEDDRILMAGHRPIHLSDLVDTLAHLLQEHEDLKENQDALLDEVDDLKKEVNDLKRLVAKFETEIYEPEAKRSRDG